MPKFHTRRPVRHSADDMFRLVADVERYPEFVPLCEGLQVLERQTTSAGEVLTARMSVGHKALRDSFITRVDLEAADRRILVTYVDGPFRHLENRWGFEPQAGGGSTVDFYIDYEFRSALLSALLGGVFDKAFRHFTAAFEDRADVIYGAAPLSR